MPGASFRRRRVSVTARRALSGLSPVPHQPSLLAFPVALGFGVAFVGGGFAFGEGEFEFGEALVVPVEARGNDGAAVAADGAQQLVDLPAVQQQAPRSARLVVEAIGAGVFGNIGVDQGDLVAVDEPPGGRALRRRRRDVEPISLRAPTLRRTLSPELSIKVAGLNWCREFGIDRMVVHFSGALQRRNPCLAD